MQDPDDRRRHRRRRRRLDRLALARGHAQGRPQVGRRRPGPALLRPRAAPRRRSPTPTSCSAGSRRTCSAARSRSTSTRPAPASRTLAGKLGPARRGAAPPASWRSPRGTRPTRCARSPSSAASTSATSRSTTFGGSGSLLLCRLMDILGLAGVLVPPEPGQRLGVRPAHRRRQERLRADRTCASTTSSTSRAVDDDRSTTLTEQAARRRSTREGFARAEHALRRARADLRYFGQAFEVRVPRARRARSTRPSPTRSPTAFHAAHRALYGYDFRGDPRQQVEWVNLRVSGIGPITRPEIARSPRPPGDGRRERRAAPATPPAVCFDRRAATSTPRVYWRADLRAGRRASTARRSSRSSARRCRCTPASPPASTRTATS